MDMSTVWVLVDNPKVPLNFMKARDYGDIEIVFDHNISPTYMQRIAPDLCEILDDAELGDYLIPTGPPALIALASSYLLSKLGELRLLQWDRETSNYYLVEIKKDEFDWISQEAVRSAGRKGTARGSVKNHQR